MTWRTSPSVGRSRTPAEIAATFENAIVKNAVDTPIKMIDVHGGLSTVAMLHRDKAETGSLIHERSTETYYILHGSGSFTTGGALTEAKPTDLQDSARVPV